MSKKKEAVLLCAGILAGATLAGPAAHALSGILAERSVQAIYVDGKQVELEAYAIEGHNYVQLRDIGRAVDFNVTYDGATNSVQIDSKTPYQEEEKPAEPPAPSAVPDGVIVIPQSDEPLNLKEGDRVLCHDGTVYEITDMDLYVRNHPNGPEPLPTPTCDWSQFPELELPKAEARHFSTEHGERLFILNLYETRRMQYTIYNAAATDAEVWENGKLKLSSDGITPYFRLQLGLIGQSSVQSFWPWRDEQLTQVFFSVPTAQFAVVAWDVYKDGKFIYTEYQVQAL